MKNKLHCFRVVGVESHEDGSETFELELQVVGKGKLFRDLIDCIRDKKIVTVDYLKDLIKSESTLSTGGEPLGPG